MLWIILITHLIQIGSLVQPITQSLSHLVDCEGEMLFTLSFQSYRNLRNCYNVHYLYDEFINWFDYSELLYLKSLVCRDVTAWSNYIHLVQQQYSYNEAFFKKKNHCKRICLLSRWGELLNSQSFKSLCFSISDPSKM